MTRLKFVSGTLEAHDLRDVADGPLTFTANEVDSEGNALAPWPHDLASDPRTRCYRAPAYRYAATVRALHSRKLPYVDEARDYPELPFGARVLRVPRPFQSEALAAWSKHRGQGVVVLPTGAGKSHLAMMAIDQKRRASLVVVPTLDLVHQWYELLRRTFQTDVGVVGGGEHRVAALTVTTYDSAYLHMENFGNRFGLVIFDECHHLPSEAYALSAKQCLAPFRLGLSATPERSDGKDLDLTDLIGPVVYRKDIVELSGNYLSGYDVQTLAVHLTDQEREEYESERAIYTAFLRAQGIRMGTPQGWGDFIMRSSVSKEGQRAMAAYRRQKAIAVAAPAKLELLAELLAQHNRDRMLVFTQDNATAYEISRLFLLPVITHQTKVTERSEILQRLASGEYTGVVTSKVLNEGVDVPEANIAVIISGSGSVREHVQRLGRILRQREGKHATLYEVVTAETAETGISDRRREHDAYR